MADKLMNTEAGGETSQYESIKTVTKDSDKQAGQLGNNASAATDNDKASTDREGKIAENIRYGQGISESGFGGKTTTSTGEANQAGYGGTEAQAGEDQTKNTRREQKYGAGNNIGA